MTRQKFYSLQMLLYKLFETWEPHRFEEHFKNIQKFYRERSDAMLASIEKHLTGILNDDIVVIILLRESNEAFV